MHIVKIAAMITTGLLAATAQAADTTSPVVGQLPDTAGGFKVYLFTLKKNGYSMQMSPSDFCKLMDYGDLVGPKFGHQGNDEIARTDPTKVIPGDLEWVICRYKDSADTKHPK